MIRSTKTKSNVIAALITFFALIIIPLNASAQESDAPVHKVRKFSVVNVSSISEAAIVLSTLRKAPYNSMIEFADDCKCFVFHKGSGLTYDTIKYLLGKKNLELKNENYVQE